MNQSKLDPIRSWLENEEDLSDDFLDEKAARPQVKLMKKLSMNMDQGPLTKRHTSETCAVIKSNMDDYFSFKDLQNRVVTNSSITKKKLWKEVRTHFKSADEVVMNLEAPNYTKKSISPKPPLRREISNLLKNISQAKNIAAPGPQNCTEDKEQGVSPQAAAAEYVTMKDIDGPHN